MRIGVRYVRGGARYVREGRRYVRGGVRYVGMNFHAAKSSRKRSAMLAFYRHSGAKSPPGSFDVKEKAAAGAGPRQLQEGGNSPMYQALYILV